MKRLLLPLAALALGGCTRAFLHPSSKVDPRFAPAAKASGLKFEKVDFKSEDGKKLTGYFIPASTGPVVGTVIHFHGNAENMTSHAFFVAWLAKEHFNVFVFDYRGYGASSGFASLSGAVKDGEAALEYIVSRPDVDKHRLIVLGQSLGGAIAVTAVARAQPPGVKAVIVESTFASYRDIAREKLKLLAMGPMSRLFSDDLSPVRYAPELGQRRLLVIHGDQDDIVPIQAGEALYKEAREPKEFWRVVGGKHIEAFTRFKEIYRPKLVVYLNEVLGPI